MPSLGPISFLLLSPVIGACLLFFIPKERTQTLKSISIASVASSLICVLIAFVKYDRGIAGYQFVDKIEWIP